MTDNMTGPRGPTHSNIRKRCMTDPASGKEIPLLEEATVVPSGVVRLAELQEQGYTCVRP